MLESVVVLPAPRGLTTWESFSSWAMGYSNYLNSNSQSPLSSTPSPSNVTGAKSLFEDMVNSRKRLCDADQALEASLIRQITFPLIAGVDRVIEYTGDGVKDWTTAVIQQDQQERPTKMFKRSKEATISSSLATNLPDSRGPIEDNNVGDDTAPSNVETFHLKPLEFQSDSIASGLGKSAFSGGSECPLRPDVLIRLATESFEKKDFVPIAFYAPIESSSKYSKEYDAFLKREWKLNIWRTMPWLVVAVWEWKKYIGNIDKKEYVAQLGYYCENYLRITPGRNVIFGVLTNCHSLIFVVAIKYIDPAVPNEYCYTVNRSVVISDNVAEQLASFVSANMKETLGFVEGFPTDIFIPLQHLGRGSTGAVTHCLTSNANDSKFNGVDVAVKVSNMSTYIVREGSAIEHIKRRIGRDGAFLPNVYDHKQIFSRALNAYPVFRDHMNVFDVYSPIPPKEWTISLLQDAWSILRKVHAQGIVHCDVRVPNFMFNADKQLILVDWSGARPHSPDIILAGNPSPGSIVTASDAVLRRMHSNIHDYQVTIADEAASLLLMAGILGYNTMHAAFGDLAVVSRQIDARCTFSHCNPIMYNIGLWDYVQQLKSVNDAEIDRINEIVCNALITMSRDGKCTIK